VQPYCEDTPDLYRFSARALLGLLAEFEVVASGPSITPGSALVMQGSQVAGSITGNKYVDFAFRKATEIVLYPLRWINTQKPEQTAGANFVIGRKPLVSALKVQEPELESNWEK
jgi:hypothetical protein